MKKILAFWIFLFVLIFAPLTYGGGGGVYATTSATDDPHWNIVRVYFDPALFTCKGMKVLFNYASPEIGDVISGNDSENLSVINSDPEYEVVDGKQYLRCSTYAKVYSKELKWNRTFDIHFNGSNLQGSRQIAISFGYGLNNYGMGTLPWEGSSDNPPLPPITEEVLDKTINLYLLNSQASDSGIRQATVKWGAFGGKPTTSALYGSTDKVNWELLSDGQRGPSATVSIKTTGEYFIKINGCVDKIGTCVDSNILSFSAFPAGPVVKAPESGLVNVEPVEGVPSVDNTSDDLSQKIASLEAKLAESEKKQGFLEQRINDLVSFIRNLFPFFK